MDLIYVEFEDHCSAAGWNTDLIDPSPIRCTAIGWIVAETAKMLVLAGCIDPISKDSTVRQYIVKSCIIKRKKLKPPR